MIPHVDDSFCTTISTVLGLCIQDCDLLYINGVVYGKHSQVTITDYRIERVEIVFLEKEYEGTWQNKKYYAM